jgi:hypothetical protein
LHFLKLKEQSLGVGRVATGTLQPGNDFALASNDLFAPGDMTADHGQMVEYHILVHASHDSRSPALFLATLAGFRIDRLDKRNDVTNLPQATSIDCFLDGKPLGNLREVFS